MMVKEDMQEGNIVNKDRERWDREIRGVTDSRTNSIQT
jgi:hypothetical protein